MDNENLSTALDDLVGAIEAITLGSVQGEVIEQAGKALICNWNDHNEDKIDVSAELNNWEHRFSNQASDINPYHRDPGACPCGEDH